jgi:Flp pilus assembly protein TadB
MTALYIISFLMLAVAAVLLLNLTPEQINEDINEMFDKQQTLKEQALTARGKKRKSRIILELERIRRALQETGKEKQFSVACTLALLLMVAGCIVAIAIDNMFLIPVLAVAFALIPFAYLTRTIAIYETQVRGELETALSLITTSYIRNDNLVKAVEENLPNLKPPIKSIFESFLAEATVISPDIRQAIYHLKEKIKNSIYEEWCDALISCQNDRTIKDTLMPVVSKLTDVRLVNNALKTMLAEARREYWIMVMMVLGNVPLLYCLNKDWYNALMHTVFGKIVLAICGVVIIFTAIRMNKITKPIEYKR